MLHLQNVLSNSFSGKPFFPSREREWKRKDSDDELVVCGIVRMKHFPASLMAFKIVNSSNISNTRKSVSSDIQTLRSGLKKKRHIRVFFNQLRSVWIPDETFFRVFDITSQSINDS